MKIGIDLDGVIFDSEKLYRVYTELYDMIELGKNSKKDNRELKFQDRFDWTDEEKDNLRSQFATANTNSMSRSNPYVFAEQGLYMLMTVLSGKLVTNGSVLISWDQIDPWNKVIYN